MRIAIRHEIHYPMRLQEGPARGRLREIEGLMVIGASMVPIIPRANTNLPTMMVAEHISTWLAGK